MKSQMSTTENLETSVHGAADIVMRAGTAHVDRMTWMQLYRADIKAFRRYREGASLPNLLFTEQGLWALLQYRFASALSRGGLPSTIKRPCLYAVLVWHKAIEVLTGISISCEAQIGPGIHIAHFGNILIGRDARIGMNCNISQGVAIGVSGRGAQRGMPHIGDRVFIGAHAVLAGKITIGDDAVIGANSLLVHDAPKSGVMIGVPARCVSQTGSHDLLS